MCKRVVRKVLRESVVAALVPEIASSGVLATVLLFFLAAGVRNRLFGQSGSGDILPVLPAVDSAALEALLDSVPGSVHTTVARSSVVLHSVRHVLLDGLVQVSFQEEGSDTSPNLH